MAEVPAKPSRAATVMANAAARPVRPCWPGLVAMTAVPATAASAAPVSPPGQPRPLSSLALGLNAAPWDYIYAANTSAAGGVDVIQPLLQAAGHRPAPLRRRLVRRLLRLADQYRHPDLHLG